jgi:ATP-dependent Clp protease ATP-binding subunit ClpA
MADPTHFTQHAAHVIHQAELEATLLHSRSIDAEHLLLALCEEQEGLGAAILHEDLHLETTHVRAIVHLVSGKFVTASAEGDAKPATAASLSDALFWAAEEAQSANHHWIGTEHLLLGLAHTRDKVVLEIFKRLNLRPEEIRAKVHARVPEIPLQVNQRAKLKDRFWTEFYHNFTYYVPQPIRRLFGRFLDASKMPPLG